MILFWVVASLTAWETHADANASLGKECTTVDTWTFVYKANGNSSEVKVGYSLTDPLQQLSSPEGKYVTSISFDQTVKYQEPGLYIPAVGGLRRISVNESEVVLPSTDFAGVGPVFRIPKAQAASYLVEIYIEGDFSAYAGIWKSAPLLCNYDVAVKAQATSALWENHLPNFVAVICLGLSILFWSIYLYTNRRFQVYKLFSWSLILWSLFFFTLSGFVRAYFYTVGTSLLYPSRIAAALGLLFLFQSYRDHKIKKTDYLAIGATCALLVVTVLLGIYRNVTLQLYCLGVSWLLQAGVANDIFRARRQSIRHSGLAAVTAITFIGEGLDLIKLLGPSIGYVSPLPYMARVTIPPTLLCSAAYFLWHFVKFFQESRKNFFRHRVSGRLALQLVNAQLEESHLIRIAGAARRLHFARRTTIAKANHDKSYIIIGVKGCDAIALGGTVRVNKFAHIANAVTHGEITATKVINSDHTRYYNDTSIAVPLPLKSFPDYLLLISDVHDSHQYTSDEVNVSRHFFATLSNAILTAQERSSRESKEREFQDLVQKLDPSLFEFIHKSVTESKLTVDETCERGVVFFDQKSYVTTLERIHPNEAALALQCIKQWVGSIALCHNSRIKAFYGDAFVIEIFPLVGETSDDTMVRTARVAWSLAESVDQLNKDLVRQSLPLIEYRFGAHFGLAAHVDIDLMGNGNTTLIGDAVNLAQRIQNEAPNGGIVVSERIAKAAHSHFVFVDAGAKYLKGRRDFIGIFRMVGIKKVTENAA